MTLDEWLVSENAARTERGEKKLTYSTIAREFGVSPQTVWAHAKGAKQPGAVVISKYEKLTGGAVALADWMAARAAPADRDAA